MKLHYKLIGSNDYTNAIVTILNNRGIFNHDHYLSLQKCSRDTYNNLDYIQDAVKMFDAHYQNQDAIGILMDNDVDGVMSTTLMYKFIKSLNPDYDVRIYVHHKNKSHGLSDNDIDLEDDIKLLIVPDAGSNETEMHIWLQQNGIDCICADHHQVTIDLKDSPAVVLNNQSSNNYQNKNCCGASITMEFCRALEEYYWDDICDNFLDIVAVANVCDVMSMAECETKAIVTEGLSNINNKMLKEMIKAQEYSMKGVVNPHTVGFYIGPLINSFIRLATFEERQLLIRSFCEDESETFEYTKRGESFPIEENIYEHVVRIAKSYKGKQDRSRDKAVGIILDKAEECRDDKVAIIDATGDIDGALTGLVAIRISETINKPVLLVREHNGMLAGSGRAFNNCPITDFRGLVEENPYMDWGTGHNSAFGTQLQYENVELAKQWFNEQLKDISMDKVYSVDFIININDMDVGFIHQIHEHQGIWAHGVNEPLVAITNISLKRTDIHVQGKNFDSVAFIIDDIKYVQFKMADDNPLLQFATQWGGDENDEIILDIVGEVSINEYKGIYTPQVMIKALNTR